MVGRLSPISALRAHALPIKVLHVVPANKVLVRFVRFWFEGSRDVGRENKQSVAEQLHAPDMIKHYIFCRRTVN